MAAQVRAAHSACVVYVSEGPFDVLTAPAQEPLAARPVDAPAIAVDGFLRALKEVQEALGHQTITMTMRYSHLAPDHLRAAVAALDGMLPAPQSEPAETSAPASAQEVLVEAIKGSR